MKKSRPFRAPVKRLMVYKWWNCPKVLRDKYDARIWWTCSDQHARVGFVWAGISKTQSEEQTDACWDRSIQMLDMSRPVLNPRGHECSVTGKSQHLQTHTHTHTHTHMQSGCSAHGASSGKLTQVKTRSEQHRHRKTIHLHTDLQHCDFSFDS